MAGWMSRFLVIVGCVVMPYTPAWTQDGSFEQASTVFIERYLQAWSGSTDAALAFMDGVYPDRVEFYGQTLTHAALMNVKRKFTERWPARSFRMRRDSMQVHCDEDHLCTVEAIFDWRYRSLERQANAAGSASLRLKLQDGMIIISEDGGVIRSNGNIGLSAAREPRLLAAAQPVRPPDVPAAGVAEASPQSAETPRAALGTEVAPPPDVPAARIVEASRKKEDPSPGPEEVVALREAYFAHAGDKDWITAWLARRRAFSGEATFVGATEDKANAGPGGVFRTTDFSSAGGSIACLNVNDASSLKIGEKVNIHGVITIFIEDVMYLGQCSVQPG